MGVYFVEAVGAGVVKIGHTNRPVAQRMSQLQTGCPHPLRVLAELDGSPTLERRLHDRFADLRVGGEWFRLDGDLQHLIWTVEIARTVDAAEACSPGEIYALGVLAQLEPTPTNISALASAAARCAHLLMDAQRSSSSANDFTAWLPDAGVMW